MGAWTAASKLRRQMLGEIPEAMAFQPDGPYRAEQNRVIARATQPIIRAQTMAGDQPRKRSHESPADSLFADIVREQTGSDAAFLPGVGYGVAILEGPITVGMLKNLIPHDSKVVTLRLRGAQIRSIIEQALVNTFTEDPKKKVGGMIQVSGVSFVFQKMVGIETVLASCNWTLAANRSKAPTPTKWRLTACLPRVATTTALSSKAAITTNTENQFDLIEAWMLKAKLVAPPKPGRIQER